MMGVTAALHVVLVGNPIHIDCDRNSHTAFVLIVMHKMHTCIFKTRAYICWIFKKRYNRIRIFAHQAWPNKKSISKLSCYGLVVST